MALRGREDVELDAAGQQRVRRLLGAEALEVPLAGRPLRLDDLAGGERGGPDVADLALLHEVGEGAQRFVDVGVRDRTVHLVEIDPIGAQATQTGFAATDDMVT